MSGVLSCTQVSDRHACVPPAQLQLVSKDSFTTIYLGNQTNFTYAGLSGEKSYSFRIREGGALGYSGWSAVQLIPILELLQPKPLVVRIGMLLPMFTSTSKACWVRFN